MADPPRDPLADLLELARGEGALAGEGLPAFVSALRERAALVLAQRTAPLEERLRELDTELAWRRESMASLEAGMRALERQLAESVRSLETELAWRRDTIAALEAEVQRRSGQAETLSGELQKAAEAHESLLAHHRDVVERVTAELDAVGALSIFKLGEARARLASLTRLLRLELR